MKTVNLSIFLLMAIVPLFGQMATFDATANQQLIKLSASQTQQNINSSKNLAESVQHTKYLDETLTFWKDTQKVLEKVSNAVSTTVYVSNLVKKEIALINQCSLYSNKIGSMKHIDLNEIANFTNSLNAVLTNSHDLLVLANNVLKSGTFKMNDSERLKNILDINDKLDENLAAMSYCFSKADNLNRERALRSTL